MSLLVTPASSASNTSTSSTGSAAAPGSGNGSGATGNSNNNLPFEKDKIWYFSNEQLTNSPSRRCGIKPDDELHYRQMTAYLIQEMGQRLQVSQLCINTAIVYMHRFYAFHSFTHFHRNSMASASLFLAAKVEEQPRKLEHVIRAANKCLPQTSEQNYPDLAQELVFNENVLLQTLGFDVAIDHPHTHVVRTCQLVKACKDLAQTSYFLASNSLHLTSMCLQYRPTVVACFCIYLACKWSRWEIPQSTEGKHWFYYVDKSVSLELLKQLTDEFIAIYEKSPARLKSKLNSIKAIAQGASNRTSSNSKDNKPKEDWKMSEMLKGYHSNITAPPELMNGSNDREPTSQQMAALLPPPSMVPQQRRGDHGGHQRTSVPTSSSSSSSSSSNHNKLPNYPGALQLDAHADHKSKQGSYNNRAPSAHQTSSSSSTQRGSSSGGGGVNSSSSSQRSSSSSQQQRPPLPMDYHKPSRGMPPVGMSAHGTHKMPTNPKQPQLLDNRSSSGSSASTSSAGGVAAKEASKASSSKMYPNAPPPYNNSGASSNLMHGAQSRSSGSYSTNGVPSSGYHSHRSKSSSSSSVHNMPPYEQLTATLPYGQSAAGANPQQPQPPHMANYNSHMQLQMDAAGAPPTSQAQQPQPLQIKNNSLFSPEWSDIKKEASAHYNGLLPPPPQESLGYKLNNHARDKDSPKKERLTPTKKDKHRATLPPMGVVGAPTTLNSSHGLKALLPPNKKLPAELLAGPTNELAGTSRDGSGALKRVNETASSQYGLSKLDDDNLPREKLRKLDNSSLPGYVGYAENDKHAPLSMSNGIETTPDLVRSLLKESLCTTNASLLKPEPLTMPGLKPPAELLEPMPMLHSKKDSFTCGPTTSTTTTTATAQAQLLHGPGLELTMLGEPKEEGVTKSEKKKKKEKHKHKEKDKSKDKSDKEERKKHKKDKQKERSKDLAGVVNAADSLKLVIKTNANAGNSNGLLAVHTAANDGAAAPLKLKISKNKMEPNNYSMAAPTTAATATGFGTALPVLTSTALNLHSYGNYGLANANIGNSSGSGSGGGGGGGGSSGKKKDRERDKEKKSKNQDYAKYNGVGGGGAYASLGLPGNVASMAAAMSTATATTTLPPSMLMNAQPTALPPPSAALPVYTKK